MSPAPVNDLTTQDSVSDPSLRQEVAGVTLSVLWHPELGRIGRTAWLDTATAGQQGLSRTFPQFDDGRPLEHRGVSRRPLLVDTGAGRVRLVATKGTLKFSVDGREVVGLHEVDPDALARGLVVGLGKGGPLVLVRAGRLPEFPHLYGMVGSSPALARVRAEFARHAQRPFPVLIRGATGTGKELVAAALHAASGRRGGYVTINVAALPASTATSQLFGHARGSFTGADRASGGYFGDAEGGTLLLDEIGTAALDLQAQLLRALESSEVQPVGARPRKVDVRVIAATDEDLELAIAEGRFRSPLMHRLGHARIVLQPLRVRPADVTAQFVHFARATAREMFGVELPDAWLRRSDAERLLAHTWPGNSRELRALAQRVAADHGTDPTARLPALVADAQVAATPRTAPPAVHRARTEADRIADALAAHDWKIRQAAEALGIGRNTLKRRMAALGLKRPGDLEAAEIRSAIETEGNLVAAARALRVSEAGLRRRMSELGLS